MDRWILIGKLSAFFAPLAFVLLTSVAVSNYPGYDMSVNFLSDLGVNEHSAVFFNAAAIIAGLIVIILSAALYKVFNHLRFCKAGALTLTLAGFFLVGVGIFTAGYGILHSLFSVLFFVAVALTLIEFGWGMRKTSNMGYFSIVMGILIPFFFSFGINPFAEHMAVGSVVLWSFGVSIFLKGYKAQSTS